MREASPQNKKAPLVYTNGALKKLSYISKKEVLANKTHHRQHRHYQYGCTRD